MAEILTRQENALRQDLLIYFNRQGSGSARGFERLERSNRGAGAIHEMINKLVQEGCLVPQSLGMYQITPEGRRMAK